MLQGVEGAAVIWKIDGLYEFRSGRLAILERLRFPGVKERRFEISEAPGYWYVELGHWRVSWRRRWIV